MKFWKQFIVDISSIMITVIAIWLGIMALLLGITSEKWWVWIPSNMFAWVMFYPIYLFAKKYLSQWIMRDDSN